MKPSEGTAILIAAVEELKATAFSAGLTEGFAAGRAEVIEEVLGILKRNTTFEKHLDMDRAIRAVEALR